MNASMQVKDVPARPNPITRCMVCLFVDEAVLYKKIPPARPVKKIIVPTITSVNSAPVRIG